MTAFDLASTPLAPGTTLIKASAGTGKTYAIVGLCVRLIAERGVRIDEIVVTTFTIPATAELRERIRQALVTAQRALTNGTSPEAYLAAITARSSPEECAVMTERIGAALRDFDQAFITTIHGLCQRLLRDQAFESGAFFDIEFLADQSGLIREVADDFWRANFYARDPLLTGFALAHGISPPTFAKLLEAAVARPMIEVRPQHGAVAGCVVHLRKAFEVVRNAWRTEEAEIRKLCAAGTLRWARSPHNKPEVMATHLDGMATCMMEGGEITIAKLDLDVFGAAARENARRGMADKELRFFDACEELCAARNDWLIALQAEFIRWGTFELARRKQGANVTSYDDLLTRLHAALEGPGGEVLTSKIRRRFRAALIDEFQDTDRVQDAIFTRLFGGAEMFLYLIGDPKQAIYAFRGADVFAYCTAAERATARFTLTENHRSSRDYLRAINGLFARPQAFVLDCIDYRDVHESGRADASPLRIAGLQPPAFSLAVWTEEKPVRRKKADDALPAAIAAQIAELLACKATIGDRSLAPSDIAVLVARNNQAHRIQTALRELNIPSVLLGNASVFKSDEASELRAILSAIATPSREPSIRGALATSILGATAATLDTLVADSRGWETRLLRFQQYHEEWRANGFIRMFRRFLRDEEVRVRLLGFPDGERRLTNLLHIAELMHCASVDQRLGISGLLKWLNDRCAATGVPAEEHELRLESDRDAVHVVTMHKSKGLQYNIVFCPYLWRAAELSKTEPLVIHDPASAHRAVLDLTRDPEIEARALTERLAEDVRLLYVAVTRARYRCAAVWGRFNQCENSAANWLLHGRDENADLAPEELADWVKAAAPAQFEAAARRIAAHAAESMQIEPMQFPIATPMNPADGLAPIQPPRSFTAAMHRDWRIASFSSLTAGEDADQPDFDRVASPAPLPAEPIVAEGIHAFPRGPKAGVCLHQIFETIDFQLAVDPHIARSLASFGYDRPEFHQAAADCVRETLRTSLPGGFSLGAVPPSAQLREVEFTFPFSRIEARDLARIFGDVPLRAGALHFEPQRGFLRGYIDLVVAHGGRFYLVDWKSNWLGPHGASYTSEAIEEEMRKHHYRLQYHLYATALDRYLRWRIPGYDYDTHFGGVFYLFLRGIDLAHPGRGVFHDRPSAKTIAALDALFSRNEPA